MKILVISHKYPPSVGGMQQHCYELVRALDKDHQIVPLIFRSNYPKLFFFITVVVRALILLRRNPDINIIYVNDGLMALVATPLLFLAGKPMVVTIHGLDISFPLGIYRFWIRKFLNRFEAIIAVSQATYDLCLTKGIEKDRLHLVTNAFDLKIKDLQVSNGTIKEISREIKASLNEKFLLISLGRGVPRKGLLWFSRHVVPHLPEDVLYLIICPEFNQAGQFRFLRKILPGAIYRRICLLVGAEIDAGLIPDLIAKKKLSERVLFLPQYARNRERIFQLLNIADLFIMPNLEIRDDFEGFGLVALEASGSGLLTLASRVDGIPSAVKDGKNGVLLTPGDAEAWTKKILELKKDQRLRDQLAKTYQKYTLNDQLTWEKMADQYINVFESVQSD